ncbi:MAG: NAD(P)-binding Rossmann-like domain, partial [Acidimicrobiia bacterium]|nr:NAD(P)-binding Rossmann-like domain [Acidimicrobiia bacterium]
MVVVGAGLGGLATACHLAGRGIDVTVVESHSHAGGLARRVQADGF